MTFTPQFHVEVMHISWNIDYFYIKFHDFAPKFAVTVMNIALNLYYKVHRLDSVISRESNAWFIKYS